MESSLEIEQQYQSNSATATYRYCKSKKHNEWSEYTIDFATMTQQNVHSERIRKVRRVQTNADPPLFPEARSSDGADAATEVGGIWTDPGWHGGEVRSQDPENGVGTSGRVSELLDGGIVSSAAASSKKQGNNKMPSRASGSNV